MQNNYIIPITTEELNEALKDYGKANPEGFWEVKGIYALPGDKCWKSKDGNCFYHWEKSTQNLSYFSFVEGKIEHAKGIYEAIYTLVCLAEPFVRLEGREGRYIKILKNFSNYVESKTNIDGNQAYIVYAGHPENIHRLERRIR